MTAPDASVSVIRGGQPTGNVSGGTLGVLQRSDGMMQVTFNGALV
jgi:hypothetical protein